ncbi:MAG: hypothetical protein IJO63_00475 [Bacilli bacterium]|nr:hypothetical protein [Bacilli bacterium]
MIYYLRDSKSNAYGFKYNDSLYYFIKNYQNDVIGITDSNNNVLCKYEYDSFGNLISVKDSNGAEIIDSSHIAYINRLRYRSYYYDSETNLYYLNTRYYSPLTGRFINADGMLVSSGLTYNLFEYCNNNPISHKDSNGNFAFSALAGAAIGWLAKETVKKAAYHAIGITANLILGAMLVDEVKEYASSSNKTDNSNKKNKKKKDAKEETGEYSVYVLADRRNVVQYVGISKDPKRRSKEHGKDPQKVGLKMHIVLSNKSYFEARALEETIIVKHEMITKGLNKIHSVSPKRENYEYYLATGESLYQLEADFKGVIWK